MNFDPQLSKKSLDETEVERDFSIRRKIKALYNKKESDFASVDDYKNYEEEVEDIVFNLVNHENVAATNEKVEKYRKENSKEIVINQSRRKEELKGESISIKEREEEIAAANLKFQVGLYRYCLFHGPFSSNVALFVILFVVRKVSLASAHKRWNRSDNWTR